MSIIRCWRINPATMYENKVCGECPLFEWFEGGIDAGWCGLHQRPAEADDNVCADNLIPDEKIG